MLWLILLLNPITTTLIMWGLFIIGVRAENGYSKCESCKENTPLWLYRLLVIGFFTIDFLYNVFYGSLFFLQLPRLPSETTFTKRVNYYLHGDESGPYTGPRWRVSLAKWICKVFFLKWDECHCDGKYRSYWR